MTRGVSRVCLPFPRLSTCPARCCIFPPRTPPGAVRRGICEIAGSISAIATSLLASEVRFQLETDGAAGAEGVLTFFGSARASLRQQMTNPDVRQRVVDISIGRNLRGIQVEQSKVYGETELEDHLAFAFEGRMPQLLRPAGSNYHLAPVLDPSSMADLVPDATREHPLEFTTWAKWKPYFVSVRLPPRSDWTFLEVPEDTVLVSEFGVYSLMFNVEGSRLDITRSLIVPPQRIDPTDYGRFAEFCRRVDAAERRDVLIGNRSEL